jgi:3-phenylpropionate/trans-cinnamate dioxygenase ferredoxin subunit
MSKFVKVATVGEIEPGRCKLIEFEYETVAVFFVEGEYYAIADVCTHDGGPLVEGVVFDCRVECPRHGATFNLKTGEPTMPAVVPVPTYAVRIEGDDILVEKPEDDW